MGWRESKAGRSGWDPLGSTLEEGPVREVDVGGFWIDKNAVTNAAFSQFVRQTGYVTIAERELDPADFPGADPANMVPGAVVFHMTDGPVDLRDFSQWWSWVPGASLAASRRPRQFDQSRPTTTPSCTSRWDDVVAYANWAGKRLPTEAEWEFAARGGLDGKDFVWGDE